MKAAAALTQTRFQNILFATDFSDAAEKAVPYINKIAQHYQSHLVAFHVRPPVVTPMTRSATWPLELEFANTVDQQHRTRMLELFHGTPTDVVIVEGDLHSCLEAAIKGQAIDLVVIGTRGRTGLSKLFLGSVAEEIFRRVPCPVLTVGPHSTPASGAPEGFREILYATDLSPDSERVARYAVSLAQEFQARLTLLHVVPEPKGGGDTDSWSYVNASCKQLLRQLVPSEAEDWCKPEYFVERGDPAERILDLATLRHADLVVIGAHETSPYGATTHLGMAIAHKVVSHAACPVLIIRH